MLISGRFVGLKTSDMKLKTPFLDLVDPLRALDGGGGGSADDMYSIGGALGICSLGSA